MDRPTSVNLPVRSVGPSLYGFYEVCDARDRRVAWGMNESHAYWLARLINGTAEATPADPDAGLSEGARSLIASVREYDAKPDVWKASLRFEASPMFGATVGGREGGAA